MSEWQPIETAPKDGTPIWAAFRADLAHFTSGSNFDLWAGVQVPLRHAGFTKSGFDIGWSVAAPVGRGGFPDSWIAGWMPFPEPPTASSAKRTA